MPAALLHKAGTTDYNGRGGYRTSNMLTRLLRASLPVVLAGTFGLQLAHADIYTWIDASGTINVSNIAPPEGVSVTKITHESPSTTATRAEAARAASHQAEVQALEERVGQLENEVQLAKSQAIPPVIYQPIPAPPVMQYIADPAPPVSQYVLDTAQPPYAGCAWVGCGWWAPGIYPVGVVVLRGANFRGFHHMRGGQHFAAHQPMRAPDRLHRG